VPHFVQNLVVVAAPQFVHNIPIVSCVSEVPAVSVRVSPELFCFWLCFHLYTLNARPRTVATALTEPVTIPMIEPVDNLEEDVDDADDADVEVAGLESLVCVDDDTPPPPDVVVAGLVWGLGYINPLTCTPHMTEGVDKNWLVVV